MPENTGIFPQTRWTLIERLRDPGQAAAAKKAIEEICSAYWYPLYVYARRFGLNESDAKDAVQELFAELLKGNRMAMADEARGRLRTFLLTALKNVIGHEREKQRAAKRGSGEEALSLDMTDAEGRFVTEVEGHEASPERMFERKWALELVRFAKDRLAGMYADEGKAELFEALAPALLDSKEWMGHHQAAKALGMNEGAVKVALHRLRVRFRQRLLAEVAQTLGDDAGEEETKREVGYLLGLFGT